MHSPRKKTWIERLLKSRYFVTSLMVHLVVFLMISIFVVIELPSKDEPVVFDGGLSEGDPAPQIPVDPVVDSGQPVAPPSPASGSPSVSAFSVDTMDPSLFSTAIPAVPHPPVDLGSVGVSLPSRDAVVSAGSFDERSKAIQKFMSGAVTKGPGTSKPAEFFCYIAKYAGGDWSATVKMDGNSVAGGSLPNLVRMVEQYSKGRIRAKLVPQPLELSSQEIFDKKPPFIFFTGRKDFKLTEEEVTNLRAYLIMGGAIWGDTALAGNGSRFDVAFRREMKRIIPDNPFEALPDSHDLYTQSFYSLKGPPAGMNFYQQPIEVIKIDGVIAVIYTVNDYGDMMQMAFKPGTKEPDLKTGPRKFVVTPGDMWDLRDSYYRNFTPDAAEQSFRLGTNILQHLLVRWNNRLELVM